MCLWIIADSLEQVGGGCFWVLTVHNPQEVAPLVRAWIVRHSFLTHPAGWCARQLMQLVHYFFTLRKVKWGQSINMSYSHYLVCWKHPGRDTQSLWDSLAIKNHLSETYYSFGWGRWKILVLGLKLCHEDSSAAHVCSCTKYRMYAHILWSANFLYLNNIPNEMRKKL